MLTVTRGGHIHPTSAIASPLVTSDGCHTFLDIWFSTACIWLMGARFLVFVADAAATVVCYTYGLFAMAVVRCV